MSDIFDLLGIQSPWIAGFLLVLAYFLIVWGLRAFVKPALVSNLDPLNITIFITVGPGLLGFLLAPFLTRNFTNSYYEIIFFFAVYLVIVRLWHKPRRIDLRDGMAPDFQFILLSLTLLIIVLNVIVNVIIPGTIPLLTEGGVYSRFDATQNSRLLSWLSMGTSPMPGLIFALTKHSRIRRFALFALVVQTGTSLLFASKGAIVTILFVLLNAMFVAKVRNETIQYRKIRKSLVYTGTIVACLIPFYFAAIGFGSGGQSTILALGVRFLGGFDQLIYASQLDLLRGISLDSAMHINLIEYQFMPVFKSVLSAQFDYSSVGQYVIEMVTGIFIEGPSTFPNSNLILETIFTSGKYLGFVAFVLELGLFYWGRSAALKRPVTPFSLVLAYGMVFNPYGLFLSGQEWVTQMIVVSLIVILAIVLVALRNVAWNRLRLALVPQTS